MLVSPSRCCVCTVAFALTLIVCGTTSVTASDDGRRAYGYGVYLLYQGRLTEAIESLDAAAADIGQDPRVYYFRGLAKRRLGQSDGAQSDFRRAARLEAASGRQDVGRALERIQGGDRLVIERFRRNARRLAKSGAIRRAPRVVGAELLPEPRSKPEVQNLAVSEVPTNLPPDARDPFASTADGLLGRGTVEKAALATSVEEPSPAKIVNSSDDEPLGSGFDEGSLAEEPFAAEFADDSEFGTGQQTGTPSPAAPKKRGMLGSVFRAVTKSAIPASPEQGKNLLDGLRGAIPVPGGPPAGGPADDGEPQFGDAPMDDEDPFGETAEPFTDEPADDDSNADADPFGDSADPFGDPADPSDSGSADDDSNTDADPFGDPADPPAGDEGDSVDDAEDPFADETDPFADDQ